MQQSMFISWPWIFSWCGCAAWRNILSGSKTSVDWPFQKELRHPWASHPPSFQWLQSPGPGPTPTAKRLLRSGIALRQVELFTDEVLTLHEQTQHDLWLSFKRSWAPTASTGCLWSSVFKSRASISSGPDISPGSEALKTKAQGLSKECVKRY